MSKGPKRKSEARLAKRISGFKSTPDVMKGKTGYREPGSQKK